MSKQTAVEWFMDILLDIEEISLSQLKEIERAYLQARQMEKEQMKEYADYAIKQLHETGICFYDEYGNLEDEKGGDHE
jgi:hypothetical protein